MTLKEKQEKEAQLVQEHAKAVAEIQRLTTLAANIQGYLLRIREEIAEESQPAPEPRNRAERRAALKALDKPKLVKTAKPG